MKDKKIISLTYLKNIVKQYKKKGKKIVFTNGCFDLLHYGHIQYLEKAKKHGDILVVALNSDRSVSRIKGPKRPLNKALIRARQLAALAAVDYITVFDDSTPIHLISALKPDILVKGADWKKTEIVGRNIVLKNRGKVKTIKFAKGFSTTLLIKKIKNL